MKSGVTRMIQGKVCPSHLDDAIAAINVELSAEKIAALEQPYVPHAVVGFE